MISPALLQQVQDINAGWAAGSQLQGRRRGPASSGRGHSLAKSCLISRATLHLQIRLPMINSHIAQHAWTCQSVVTKAHVR